MARYNDISVFSMAANSGEGLGAGNTTASDGNEICLSDLARITDRASETLEEAVRAMNDVASCLRSVARRAMLDMDAT